MAGSSASLTPSSPWDSSCMPRGFSSAASSCSLPVLLLARTSLLPPGFADLVIEQCLGEANRQIPVMATGPCGHLEGHQFAVAILVLGNKIAGVSFLDATERQKACLADIVQGLPLDLTRTGAQGTVVVTLHNRNVDDAYTPAAVEIVGRSDFRGQEGAGENVVVDFVLAKANVAVVGHGWRGESRQHQAEPHKQCNRLHDQSPRVIR